MYINQLFAIICFLYHSSLSSINHSAVCGTKTYKGTPDCTSQPQKASQQVQSLPRYWPILPKPVLPYKQISAANSLLDRQGQSENSSETLCATRLPLQLRKNFAVAKNAQTQTSAGVNSVCTQTSQHPITKIRKPTAHSIFTQTCQPLCSWGFNATQTEHASVGTQVALLEDHCDFTFNPDNNLPCLRDSNSLKRMFQLSESFTQTPDISEVFACAFPSQDQCGHDFAQASIETGTALPNLADDPVCFNTHTQTLLTSSDMQTSQDIRPLSSIQTQTQGVDSIALEDNETQTLISVLGLDSANSTESGTQTQSLLDDIFGAGPDVELTDTQTQTWLDDLVGCSSVADSDFVDDLVNMHTQTALVMADFSEFSDDSFVNSQTQTAKGDGVECNFLSSASQTDDLMMRLAQRAQEGGYSGRCMDTDTQTLRQ